MLFLRLFPVTVLITIGAVFSVEAADMETRLMAFPHPLL